jgi:naphthoate synthase
MGQVGQDGAAAPFDPARWTTVPGFDDLTDVTYHRAVGDPGGRGTVRVAIDRPEVRNAFRPQTVDELLRVLDHARRSPDVATVLLTGNGPSAKDGGRAFCSGGDQRIRSRDGYRYEGDAPQTRQTLRPPLRPPLWTPPTSGGSTSSRCSGSSAS